MYRPLYLAGIVAPMIFLLSVVIGGARRPGYSHLADPVSELGMLGATDAWAINATWAATGLLIMVLGLALWTDRMGPGRGAAGALMLAGAASAAIAVWFPMDPPGVQMSTAQQGHNILVALAAIFFAIALFITARSAAAPPAYRRLTWVAIGAMALGGAGAALSHASGVDSVGAFERITQAGYHGWIFLTAATGSARGWRNVQSGE